MCNGIRLKWIAKEIGFERIILKNNNMHAYLPEENNHQYYNSETFNNILIYLKNNSKDSKMIEKKGKLSMRIKNINSINKALIICKQIIRK